jgi:hypothetical protein
MRALVVARTIVDDVEKIYFPYGEFNLDFQVTQTTAHLQYGPV